MSSSIEVMVLSNALDRLADELLVNILEYTLTQETPFWIDEVLQLPWLRFTMPGHPRPEITVKQDVHRKDWLIINSTCRRFRQLGKHIFFRTRAFVMTLEMHEKLIHGTSWLDLGDNAQEKAWGLYKHDEDREIQKLCRGDSVLYHNREERWCALSDHDHTLALSAIRHVVFSNVYRAEMSGSRMFRVPKLSGVFPSLRRCDIIIGPDGRDGSIMEYKLYVSDQESEVALCKTAAKLEELLKSVGMSANIRLGLPLGWGSDEESRRKRIESELFPMLKFRATALNRQRENSGK